MLRRKCAESRRLALAAIVHYARYMMTTTLIRLLHSSTAQWAEIDLAGGWVEVEGRDAEWLGVTGARDRLAQMLKYGWGVCR